MLLDKKSMFSDAQVVTITAAATNVIDLGSARNIGQGEPLNVHVQVTAAMTAGGTSLDVRLVGDTALPIDGSSVVLASTGAILAATLVAGYEFALRFWPTPASPAYRYVSIYYVAVGTFSGGGHITAGISGERDDLYAYPAASYSG